MKRIFYPTYKFKKIDDGKFTLTYRKWWHLFTTVIGEFDTLGDAIRAANSHIEERGN
jgi:hypothetical protein